MRGVSGARTRLPGSEFVVAPEFCCGACEVRNSQRYSAVAEQAVGGDFQSIWHCVF